MNYMFQNFFGFQKHRQLIVTAKVGEVNTIIEIREDNNPEDSKQYQLTDNELLELWGLLNSFIDKNSINNSKINFNIKNTEIVD